MSSKIYDFTNGPLKYSLMRPMDATRESQGKKKGQLESVVQDSSISKSPRDTDGKNFEAELNRDSFQVKALFADPKIASAGLIEVKQTNPTDKPLAMKVNISQCYSTESGSPFTRAVLQILHNLKLNPRDEAESGSKITVKGYELKTTRTNNIPLLSTSLNRADTGQGKILESSPSKNPKLKIKTGTTTPGAVILEIDRSSAKATEYGHDAKAKAWLEGREEDVWDYDIRATKPRSPNYKSTKEQNEAWKALDKAMRLLGN